MPTLDETLKKYKDFINRDMPKHYFRSSLLSFNALIGDMRGFKGGRIVQIVRIVTGKQIGRAHV